MGARPRTCRRSHSPSRPPDVAAGAVVAAGVTFTPRPASWRLLQRRTPARPAGQAGDGTAGRFVVGLNGTAPAMDESRDADGTLPTPTRTQAVHLHRAVGP